MSEFLLVFRRDYKTKELQPSPDQMQDHLAHWQAFFESLKDKLARPVQRFDAGGEIVMPDQSVIGGPYAGAKDAIGGLVFINAADYDEAVKIAQTCPILKLGGSVEVRQAI